jgi:type IV secretory pathway VirB6-like protein
MGNTAITFVGLASSRVATLQAVMNAVLASEQSVLFPILNALMIIFVGRQFLLVMYGNMTVNRFLDSIIRAGIICLLVTHSGAFTQWVSGPVFTKVPAALTSLATGSYGAAPANTSSAAQFDSVSSAGDSIAAQIVALTTVSSPSSWINAGTAYAADGFFQIILCCIFGIWLLGLGVLAIALCLGPPFLLFELFDRTRGFVDQWIAKLVGFTAFGFATSLVLAMQLQGLTTMLQQANGMAASNVPAAVGMLLHCVSNSVMDLLLMAACPIAFGFGSGAVAAMAAPASFAAMRSLSIGGAVVRAATSGKPGTAVRASANAMKRS